MLPAARERREGEERVAQQAAHKRSRTVYICSHVKESDQRRNITVSEEEEEEE